MLPIQHYFPKADALVYGCMGLGGSWDQPTTSKEQRDLSFTAIDAALEAIFAFLITRIFTPEAKPKLCLVISGGSFRLT